MQPRVQVAAIRRPMVAAMIGALILATLPGIGLRTVFAAAIDDATGCLENMLPANDDGSTGAVEIGFTIDFFGASHSSLFVNNNGNVTFTEAHGDFTPEPIVGAGQAIIAPFWADVDTTGDGSAVVTYGQATVGGRDAFCVNWDGVGYFGAHTDKLNEFQLLLVDRSDLGVGDFDIVFNYDQIQWETGDASGGTGGLGGSSARAGWSNGDPETPETSFELAGSAVNGAFLDSNTDTGLIHNSANSGLAGRYVYAVRNGTPGVVHTLDVTILGDGGGTVTSDPAGIDCEPTCTASFNEGAEVTLTPDADEGSEFAGWAGDCTGTGACMVTMDVDRDVTATFDPIEPPAAADLSISSFTDSPDPVSPSAPVRYEITVANTGAGAATDATLTAQLPSGTTLLGSDAGCTVGGEDDLNCDLGTIGAESSTTATIDLGAPATTGPFTFSVFVSSPEDTDGASDSEETTVTDPATTPDDGSGFATGDAPLTVVTTPDGVQFSTITVPTGVSGAVTMHEEDESVCTAVVPAVTCIGERLDLDAPSAPASNPLVLRIRVAASEIPKSVKNKDLVVSHLADGAASYTVVPSCQAKRTNVANPAPSCVSRIGKVRAGGVRYIEFLIFTTDNGSWRPGFR